LNLNYRAFSGSLGINTIFFIRNPKRNKTKELYRSLIFLSEEEKKKPNDIKHRQKENVALAAHENEEEINTRDRDPSPTARFVMIYQAISSRGRLA